MTDATAYIEARVQFEPNTGCWLWERGADVDGYGRVGSTRAHRVSFRAYNGVDPGPLHVLHRCDTPACVNPAHLRLGTHKQNMEDCSAKGRVRLTKRGPLTHCGRGHEFTPANSYFKADGKRRCRTCIAAERASRVRRTGETR